MARCALGALTTASAILHGLAVERWPIVRAALAAGVSVAELGAAMGGLHPHDVTTGLGSWADRRYRSGAMSPADHSRTCALLALTGTTA